MGVPGYLVASSVVAILAQRLVRTICPKCKVKFTPSQEVIKEVGLTAEQLDSATFMRGKGCSSCQKTGYRGRIGIYELMLLDSKIRRMIFDGAATQVIREYAISSGGMDTLFTDGVKKVLGGVTTFEEVYRVAKKTQQDS